MGISRRSTFLHVFASCSDVSVGGVRESNESRTLSWWILGYADDFSILQLSTRGIRGVTGRGEAQAIETSLRTLLRCELTSSAFSASLSTPGRTQTLNGSQSGNRTARAAIPLLQFPAT